MTLRMTKPRARRKWGVLLTSVVLLMTVAGGAAFAVHDDGVFELDRNVANDAAAGEDWADIYAGTDTAGSDTGIVIDPPNATIFTTGGSKDDLNTTSWKHKSGSSPDKDELAHAYAARYDDVVYFGADRIDASGAAALGFWFFQEDVSALPGGTFGPDAHKDGDILILSDFSVGGGTVTIRVFRWNGPGGDIPGSGTVNGVLDLLAGTNDPDVGTVADCVGPPAVGEPDPFCATVNNANVNSPWPFTPKDGPANVFGPGEFYEGGIDLANFPGLSDSCFASFLAETRTSPSVGSQLKDFVGGGFEDCTSSVVTTPVNANGATVTTLEKGNSIQDHAVISGTGSGEAPEGTMDFSICSPSQLDDASLTDDPATCDVGGTKVNGTGGTNAAVPVTQIGTTATSEATSSAFTPTTTGKWCWRGDYSGDTNYPAASDSSAGECFTVVDAKISVTPLTATNESGTAHTVTATVQQDTGSGFVSVPNGTTVTFSLQNNNAGASFVGGVSSCTTTSGSCSIQITTTSTGTVDIRASSTFTVSGLSLTRTTGSGGNNSADANKRYVDAQIDLTPLDDTNGITENHTITATVQQDDGLAANTGGGDAVSGFGPAPNGTTVTFSFVGTAATFVNNVNTCTTTGGTCSIQIVSATAGTFVVNATTTFNIGPAVIETVTRTTGTGGNNSANAEKEFIDGSLAWFKNGHNGNRLAGATFSVCRTQDRFGNAVSDTCITVLDDSAADADADDGEFLLNDLKLGHYTVTETLAPAGYQADSSTKTADLTLDSPNATISVAFVNNREVLKITGFGYTNDAVGAQAAGVITGTTTFTAKLHNYGTSVATLSNSSLAVTVTGGGTGTLTCEVGDGNTAAPHVRTITDTILPGEDGSTVSVTCNYTNMADGAFISATLNINSTTNGLERPASGSPATISFTVQAN
jgi:prealbumin domain-containing protein